MDRASADARTGGAVARPDLGSKATRLLALSQTEGAVSPGGLSADEREVIRRLEARNREVLRHEQAHAMAGGSQTGNPSFTYQTGPDGKRYAIGGEVPIDTSPVPDDPKATIAKMEIVKAAALAPAKPSMPDRRIAAQAEATRLAAIAELAASRSASVGEPEDGPGLTGRLFNSFARPEPESEISRAV